MSLQGDRSNSASFANESQGTVAESTAVPVQTSCTVHNGCTKPMVLAGDISL